MRKTDSAADYDNGLSSSKQLLASMILSVSSCVKNSSTENTTWLSFDRGSVSELLSKTLAKKNIKLSDCVWIAIEVENRVEKQSVSYPRDLQQ